MFFPFYLKTTTTRGRLISLYCNRKHKPSMLYRAKFVLKHKDKSFIIIGNPIQVLKLLHNSLIHMILTLRHDYCHSHPSILPEVISVSDTLSEAGKDPWYSHWLPDDSVSPGKDGRKGGCEDAAWWCVFVLGLSIRACTLILWCFLCIIEIRVSCVTGAVRSVSSDKR